MTGFSKNKRELLWATSLAVFLAAGLPIAQAQDGTGRHGMHGSMQKHGMHQAGMQKGRHGKGHSGGGKHCGHGKRHGKSHGRHHQFGDHWKKTLTAEQKVQLDRLHLDFAKKKHTLKSGIQALKVQLAVTAVADQPQPQAIEAQINDLLMGERQLMQATYGYIAAQRQVLTPEQRVSFDMDIIHKADTAKAKSHH